MNVILCSSTCLCLCLLSILQNLYFAQNACIASSTDIILFKDQSPGSRAILSDTLRDLLSKSSSGFIGKDSLFNFIEVSSEIYDLAPHLENSFDEGAALIASPPYANSIFHAAQVLMQVIRVANLIR
jgi:hypothetical protein